MSECGRVYLCVLNNEKPLYCVSDLNKDFLLPAHVVYTSHRLLDHLVGLVAKASASRAEDPGFDSCSGLADLTESSNTSDLKIHTPVVTLPGAWSCRVSAGLVGSMSIFWVRFLRTSPFFNPKIVVVTFRLRGRCVQGVFLLPAFTHLGHKCQDLLSPCDGMHV